MKSAKQKLVNDRKLHLTFKIGIYKIGYSHDFFNKLLKFQEIFDDIRDMRWITKNEASKNRLK